jgi:hypothetical protein
MYVETPGSAPPTTRNITFRAFHRALARLGLTSRLPSSATFAERERRRGAGRCGRRGRVRPSARGGHAHGGGAAVRRAGCEDPGKADSLHGEQVAPRQGEGLQRVPLQAQRAPRHSQGRTRMMTDVVFKRKAKRRKRRTEKKFFRGRRRGGKRGGGDGVARDARVLSSVKKRE